MTSLSPATTERAPDGPASIRAARRRWPIFLWVALLVAGFFVSALTSPYGLVLAVHAVPLALLALSTGWLFHHTGLLSFGNAAFAGLAMYATAVLVNRYSVAPGTAILISFGLVVAIAFVTGLILVRVHGIAFSMVTLASSMLLWVGVTKSRDWTNGFDGLSVDWQKPLWGHDVYEFSNADFAWPRIWVVLAVVMGIAALLSRSSFGVKLDAIHDNEERLRFTGHRTHMAKVLAFTVAGACAALAGIVQVLTTSIAVPGSIAWSASGIAIVVAIIGGVAKPYGPVIGAFFFIWLESVLLETGNYQLILGLLLMIIVIAAPGGLVGLVSSLRSTLARRRRAHAHD